MAAKIDYYLAMQCADHAVYRAYGLYIIQSAGQNALYTIHFTDHTEYRPYILQNIFCEQFVLFVASYRLLVCELASQLPHKKRSAERKSYLN